MRRLNELGTLKMDIDNGHFEDKLSLTQNRGYFMRQVNIHEAKTHLSRLIAEGEEIVIARYGKPVARLVPIISPVSERVPGSSHGKFQVPSEFFEPLPDEILNAFEK